MPVEAPLAQKTFSVALLQLRIAKPLALKGGHVQWRQVKNMRAFS